ncbi:Peptidase C26 [uncultured Caudovirales phage]|uniref:Peptidase C26 n=1 Tax=uncultured Caudovirales phage TaxID=2100421 RepID=A0A6J7WZC7_9CAUD|nr:Peptidase C26 [uncultured Caudovirales phage]CAB5222082.1 Peptidase C26 [uncultured Caudovirales phage]
MTTVAYSPWGNGNSIYPFDAIFDHAVNAYEKGFKNVDAFLLWGGTDIHPSFYDESPHRHNQAPAMPSPRDVWEWQAMKHCKAHGIPIIGVCRGAQFMCAFAGGKLIQHVMGHDTGGHEVVTADGETFRVTSAHHQMLDLINTNHELIAWTPTKLSAVYYGAKSETPEHLLFNMRNDTFKEPEIVFFPEFKGLAIQGHPEWAEIGSDFVNKTNELVVEYLFNKEW